jgi:Tfp pilus assembly protein PilF
MKSYAVLTVLAVALACSACRDAATTDSDASAMLARATDLFEQGGETNLREAINVFKGCVQAAPDYAPCYAGLARTYTSIGGSYNIMVPDEAWPAAREAAEKAVALDDELAAAHLALAEVIAGQDWNWTAAEGQYQRAIELNSDDLQTLMSHAWFLYNVGRHDEASATVARIRELAPEFSPFYLEYLLTGDVDRAKNEVEELIASDLQNPNGYWVSANLHAREGEYEEAAEQLQKQIPLMAGDVVDEVALLGHVYARMGLEVEAREMLERLDALPGEGRYVSPVNKAWIHAGLGEVDQTLDLLREGIETRAHRSGLGMTGFAFVYEPISDDPRFGALLDEIGLSE